MPKGLDRVFNLLQHARRRRAILERRTAASPVPDDMTMSPRGTRFDQAAVQSPAHTPLRWLLSGSDAKPRSSSAKNRQGNGPRRLDSTNVDRSLAPARGARAHGAKPPAVAVEPRGPRLCPRRPAVASKTGRRSLGLQNEPEPDLFSPAARSTRLGLAGQVGFVACHPFRRTTVPSADNP